MPEPVSKPPVAPLSDEARAFAEWWYTDMRRMAGALMRGARSSLTLQPTDLVHEFLIRFAPSIPHTLPADPDQRRRLTLTLWVGMKRLFIDELRKHQRRRRRRVAIELIDGEQGRIKIPDIERFSDALAALADVYPERAAVIVARFFFGFTIAEAGELLGMPHATLEREQRRGLEWLRARLSGNPDTKESTDGP